MPNFIATYHKEDELGNADFICEVVAADEARALEQARWQLMGKHPNDSAFAFVKLEAVKR